MNKSFLFSFKTKLVRSFKLKYSKNLKPTTSLLKFFNSGILHGSTVLEAWFEQNVTSPTTGEIIKQGWIDNKSMKQFIIAYMMNYPEKKNQQFKPSNEYSDNHKKIKNIEG